MRHQVSSFVSSDYSIKEAHHDVVARLGLYYAARRGGAGRGVPQRQQAVGLEAGHCRVQSRYNGVEHCMAHGRLSAVRLTIVLKDEQKN